MSIPVKFHPFEKSDAKANWAGYTSPRMGFFNTEIPDVNFGTGFLVATRWGTMDIPHIHDGAFNYFIFTGADLANVFESEFEVAICLGDSAKSMEIPYHKAVHRSRPSRRGAQPCLFQKSCQGPQYHAALCRAHHGEGLPRYDKDGNEEWTYGKDKPRPCVKTVKECTFCGLCFTNPDETEQDVINYMKPYYENASTAGKYKIVLWN